jgi:hypothetical protein
MSVRATIRLGTLADAKSLFTYPNDGHEQQTLAETVRHWMAASISREGISPFDVALRSVSDVYEIHVTCPDQPTATAVEVYYQPFFDLGVVGRDLAEEFKATGSWNASWKFLLPLGLSLVNSRAVEIMDFPPLSLITKQDYLNSKTTNRWWELLTINGVSDADKTRFTSIVDIVPVAAPANHGRILDESGIYEGPFDEYSLPLLDLFSRPSTGQMRRPLVALGLPIRKWIERLWGKQLDILDVDTISVSDTDTSPVIASNHPAFFFYAVRSNSGPDADRRNLAAGLAVMKKDIVAAYWHAQMGKNHKTDPDQVLHDGSAEWANREAELLDLVKKQAGIDKERRIVLTKERKMELEAELEALRGVVPTDEELAEMERKFHADESATEDE